MNTKPDNELLPCPFCGSEAFMQEHPPHQHSEWLVRAGMPKYSSGNFTVECTNCECGMIHETREAVINAWNTRQPTMPADADPLQGAADWLLNAVEDCDHGDLQYHLRIGANRAKRLMDEARRRIEGES